MHLRFRQGRAVARSHSLRASVPILLFLAGCSGANPRQTIDRYHRALEQGDTDTLWSLSDASFRRAHSKQDLRSVPKEQLQQSAARLAGSTSSERETVQVKLNNGTEVLLLRESGGWKIVRGGLAMVRQDTPEAALETFFRAAKAMRLIDVRALIPSGHAEMFRSDEALASHLEQMQGRITRARAAIGTLTPGQAVIEGEQAKLVYGNGGTSVLFVLEGDRWCILDLE